MDRIEQQKKATEDFVKMMDVFFNDTELSNTVKERAELDKTSWNILCNIKAIAENDIKRLQNLVNEIEVADEEIG